MAVDEMLEVPSLEECFDCAQSCSDCADACLAEDDAALRGCIGLTLDCAGVCDVAARLMARSVVLDLELARSILRACNSSVSQLRS